MKARLVEQRLYEGNMDYIHNGGYMAKRLLIKVPEGILVVTLDNNGVLHSFLTDKFEDTCKDLGKVKVSKVFVARAKEVALAEKEFQSYQGWFKSEFLK